MGYGSLTPVVIAPIVEGHGEVQAVPVLIRRVAAHVAPGVNVDVPRPHRRSRSKLVRSDSFDKFCRVLEGWLLES